MAIGTPVNRGSTATNANGSTLAVTTTGAVAAGSKIILSAGWRSANTLVSVSDNSGSPLTWVIDYQAQDATASRNAVLISADAPSGLASGTVITLTLSGSTTDKIVSVEEVTGLATGGFDQSSHGDGGNSTTFDTGLTPTTTQADELLMSVLFLQVVQTTVTWGDSFTQLQLLSANVRSLSNAYRIVSATGTYKASGSYGTGQTNEAIIGTYKAAAGGGGSPQTILGATISQIGSIEAASLIASGSAVILGRRIFQRPIPEAGVLAASGDAPLLAATISQPVTIIPGSLTGTAPPGQTILGSRIAQLVTTPAALISASGDAPLLGSTISRSVTIIPGSLTGTAPPGQTILGTRIFQRPIPAAALLSASGDAPLLGATIDRAVILIPGTVSGTAAADQTILGSLIAEPISVIAARLALAGSIPVQAYVIRIYR